MATNIFKWNLTKVGLVTGICFLMAESGQAASASADAANKDAEDMAFQAPWNGEALGTGVRRPNAEQWAWGEEHMIKTRQVKLNRLGLERVNKSRLEHGKWMLTEEEADVAPDGAEVVGATGSAPSASDTTTTSNTRTPSVTLPGSVDNSTLNYFPPIRSQGSLNSCAQFSGVYYTLTHMTAMARNWDAKNGGDSFRFSPKWTYNMLNGGANVGTTFYDAYAIAQKHGVATWAEFPYDGDYLGWCLNPEAWRHAIYTRANQTGKVLDVDTDAGLSQLKQLLVNGYVLNFATYINSWQWKAIGNDPNTTADDAFAGKQAVTLVNGSSGGHAMTIVGFNDDLWVDLNGDGLVTANEKGALRIANSWGTGWGEAGFCWISFAALKTRNAAYTSEGLFWYDEATWVTALTDYQPTAIAQFTLNHAKRNQLQMTLGISDTASTSPVTTWLPYRILNYAGGAYAFDGSSTACDATFYLDLSDLVPSTQTPKRYYLGMRDSAAGDSACLKSYTLIDLAKNAEMSAAATPLYADATLAYAIVDFAAGNGPLPDVSAPSATIISPAGGSQITGSVTVSATATDDTGVASVTLSVDGVAKSTLSAAPYSFSLNSTTIADGNHTLTVTAKDAAGNAGQAAISIVVKNAVAADDVPPAVVITSPNNGTKITSASTTVTVNATDNVKVAKVDLYVDGSQISSSTASPFKLSWNTKKLATGAHAITCIAYDAAGNSAMSPVVSVTK
jgi:C1A family cysteine protease